MNDKQFYINDGSIINQQLRYISQHCDAHLPALGAREGSKDAGHAVQLPQRAVHEALVDRRLGQEIRVTRGGRHGKTMGKPWESLL